MVTSKMFLKTTVLSIKMKELFIGVKIFARLRGSKPGSLRKASK